MNAVKVERLCEIAPVPSTSFSVDTNGRQDGADFVIDFDYMADDDVRVARSIRFLKARAVRWQSEPYCEVWQVQEPYDHVAEVVDSKWVKELVARDTSNQAAMFTHRHFAVYIDSVGCFEVVSDSVVVR